MNNYQKVIDVAFIKDEIAFILNDGRIVYVPLKWSDKLLNANHQQRSNYINSGIHVFWDDLDEIIGVKNILFGKECLFNVLTRQLTRLTITNFVLT